LVVVGCLFSITSGALLPTISIAMGRSIQMFDPNTDTSLIDEQIAWLVKFCCMMGGLLWFTGYFQYAFIQHMAEKLSFDLRTRYLRALMR
jgi:hypothetical protein